MAKVFRYNPLLYFVLTLEDISVFEHELGIDSAMTKLFENGLQVLKNSLICVNK